jgi:predicted ATPase
MIQKIRLTNFFSFKDEEIHLEEDANILLGVNGSGKTNLIKAIKLLREGVSGEDALKKLIVEKWGGWENIYCKAGENSQFPNSIGLEFTLGADALSKYGFGFFENVLYKVILIKKPNKDNYYVSESLGTLNQEGQEKFTYITFHNGKGKLHEHASFQGNPGQEQLQEPDQKYGRLISYDDQDPQELVLGRIFDSDRYYEINTVRKAISDLAYYPYFNTSPESQIRRAVHATGSKKLNADGGNLPQILNTLKINHKNEYGKIVTALQEVNENFRGFDFNFLGSGWFELMLDEESLGSSIHVTHISDGTLYYLCQLGIFYNPLRGNFVAIDEPETGLHPDMMHNITKAIRETADTSTYLVSTHHPDIVDGFEIRHMRVFEKDEDNTTKVVQYSEKDFEGWFEAFKTGKMWREGDFGGNRW